MNNGFVWVILSIIGFIFCFFGVKFFWYILQGYKSQFWPTTKGKIKGSTVREREDHETGGLYCYETVISYEYVVEGNTYTSTRMAFEDPWSFGDNCIYSHQKYTNPLYFADDIVDVYYNPKDPNEGVLCPSIDKEYVIERIIFIIVLTFVVIFFIKESNLTLSKLQYIIWR